MMADDAVLQWITGNAHNVYLMAVGLFGGGPWAQAIVGNAALAVVTVLTVLSARFVVAQVWDIGVALLKIVAALLFAVFCAVWTVRVYVFVYGTATPAMPSFGSGDTAWSSMAWRWLGLDTV